MGMIYKFLHSVIVIVIMFWKK